MDLTEDVLAEKPKHVALLKGRKIYRVSTVGGLHLLVKPDGENFEVLSLAPHPGIAAFIAENKNPELTWLELSKSQNLINPESEIVQKYVSITDQVIAYQKR